MTAGRAILFGVTAWLVSSTAACADWMLAAYLGTTWTRPASLTVDRGSSSGEATLTGVAFDSRSFESPPYYGYRFGWFKGRSGVGAEGELIHLKVFARPETLGANVRRFSISHGLNLLGGERGRTPSFSVVAPCLHDGATGRWRHRAVRRE